MRLLVLLFAFVAGSLSGCGSFEPDYPKAVVIYDGALLGTWEWRDPDNPEKNGMRATVEPRAVPVKGGRLNPPGLLGASQAGDDTVQAYRVVLHSEKPPESVDMAAYLVQIGEQRLLGFQVTLEQLSKAAPPPLALPVHWLLRLQRDGDTVSLATGKGSAGWVPLVTFLDAVASADGGDGRVEPGSLAVTNSIDRLLQFYKGRMEQPGFWSEKAMVWRRVPQTP